MFSDNAPFPNRLSIHAPTRGATDSIVASTLVSLLSIHAPTRGATYSRRWFSFNICFQSTLLQEERHTYRFKRSCGFSFQSTLLQEERQKTQIH